MAIAVGDGVARIVAGGSVEDDGAAVADRSVPSLRSSPADGGGDPGGTGLAMQPARVTAAIAVKIASLFTM